MVREQEVDPMLDRLELQRLRMAVQDARNLLADAKKAKDTLGAEIQQGSRDITRLDLEREETRERMLSCREAARNGFAWGGDREVARLDSQRARNYQAKLNALDRHRRSLTAQNKTRRDRFSELKRECLEAEARLADARRALGRAE